MSKIRQLTQAIRNYAECELDYGTLRTLKMIDEEADRLETKLQNTSSNSDYAKCPCCGEPWDIRRNRACKCGAVIQCKHFA